MATRETLEIILGRPMSDWLWLKASLPSSRCGINFRSAALHAPAAFIASASHSARLMGDMLGQSTIHLNSLLAALPALSETASKPDWLTLEDVNVALHQKLPLTRPPSIACSHWHPLIASELWHSPPLYPTLQIG